MSGVSRLDLLWNIHSDFAVEAEYDATAFIDMLFSKFSNESFAEQHKCFKHLSFMYPPLSRYKIFQPVVWWGELMVGLLYHRLNLKQSFKHATTVLLHYDRARLIMKQIGLH